MNIFVTGASGYIGSAIVAALVARGHQVRGLARSADAEAKVRVAGAEPVLGDLTNCSVLAAAAAASDAVVHTAATAGADRVSVDEAAVTAMLGAMRRGVFVATTGAPRARSSRQPVSEEDVTPLGGPLDWLAVAEARVLEARGTDVRGSDVRGIVVRPPIVYGDGGGPLRRLSEQARRDGVARFVDAGDNRWSVVHVRDLARAYALLVESPLSGAFHVAEAEPLPMHEIMTAVSRHAGVPVASWSLTEAKTTHGPLAGFLAMDAALDAARLRRLVGWQPTVANALGGLLGAGIG